MHPETKFRRLYVDSFLTTLTHAYAMTIQQQTIHGHPDKVLCIHGRFVAIEIKAANGRLRPLQAYVLAEIEKAGGIALVASPQTWEAVKARLRKLDQGEFT